MGKVKRTNQNFTQPITIWCETEGIHKSLSKAKFRDGVKAWGGVHKRIVEDHKRRFVYGNIYWFG